MQRKHVALALVAVSLGSVALAGCSDGRSVEAYCAVVAEHKEEYLSLMGQANGMLETQSAEGALGGLFTAANAMSSIRVMFKEMADVAPEEIRTETEEVADAFDQAAESAGSFDLGGLASALGVSINSAYSMQKVDEYVEKNCGDNML